MAHRDGRKGDDGKKGNGGSLALPSVRKDITAFLVGEEARITKKGALKAAAGLTILGVAFDAFAANHSHHANTWTYLHHSGDQGRHVSHGSHGSHGSHASHGSHGSW